MSTRPLCLAYTTPRNSTMVIGTTVFPYLQVACLIAILIAYQASALSPPPALQPQLRRHDGASVASSLASEVMAFCLISAAATAGPAFADEIGVEKDAPTLYTGETIEICTKRGPLGACLRTEYRTDENDNDKAKKYFRYSSKALQERNEVLQGFSDGDSNELITRLKQQTEDNREKNQLEVERKTFENDQSATFGPFDRQVVIMNTDGKTFTLLQNAQAMRLKKQGFIQDRRFVQQPTEEEIAQALEPDGEGLADAIQALLGGGN